MVGSVGGRPFPGLYFNQFTELLAIPPASSQRYIPPGQRAAMSAGDQMVQSCKQFLSQIDKYDPNSAAAGMSYLIIIIIILFRKNTLNTIYTIHINISEALPG